MKNFFKSKVTTSLILIATVTLAGIAVFTAYRLYQLRQESVAPNAPTSRPKAEEASTSPSGCSSLTFNISPSASATATATATTTTTATATATTAPTAAPTAAPTTAPTPTTTPELPDSGFSLPTVLGISTGTILLIAAFALAL